MWSSIPFSHTKRSHMGVHHLTILHSYPRTPRHNLLINPFPYISSLKFVRKNDKFWRSPSQFSSFHVHIWIFRCASNLTSVFSGLVMVFCYFVSLTTLHLTLRLHKSPLGGKQLRRKGRVPALPTRNCREYSNIFAARCRKVSAIHVTETNMHERLVLISGQVITGPLSPLALGTRTPTISHCC